MRRGRFTEDQIIGVLREHEAGVKTVGLCHEVKIANDRFSKLIGRRIDTRARGLDDQLLLGALVDRGETAVRKEPFLLLPAIDLRGGKAVRLRQGEAHRETR